MVAVIVRIEVNALTGRIENGHGMHVPATRGGTGSPRQNRTERPSQHAQRCRRACALQYGATSVDKTL